MGRKSQEPLTLVPGSAPTLADPPPTLREAGATLWRSIMAEYAIADSGGRAILEQACASQTVPPNVPPSLPSRVR